MEHCLWSATYIFLQDSDNNQESDTDDASTECSADQEVLQEGADDNSAGSSANEHGSQFCNQEVCGIKTVCSAVLND